MPTDHILRDETEADVPFLRLLYRKVRWDETAMMGMTDAGQRTAFLDQQFAAQRAHYRAHYGDAEFSVIEADGAPIGRLYLWCGADDHRIVDISLLPEVSGGGIGGRILDAVLVEAAERGRSVSIHVEAFNPARRLYDRKGFVVVEQVGPYWKMVWR